MTSLCCDVLKALRGKTLVTAESLTGGGIGAALTQVPGSSEVYKGGVICYTNWVKENILGVPGEILARDGAVSRPTAEHLASGVRARSYVESPRGTYTMKAMKKRFLYLMQWMDRLFN